jgi:aminoglycoside phosphotransferase family enzyme/predicted kinase
LKDHHPSLIQSLQDAGLYDHPTDEFRVIETHISWILLTGRYAYKIKKPVDLGFVDFTTLERRRYFCEEELRLNRRLAPALYVGVIGIYGSAERPRLRPGGEPFEYAVKMVQFDPSLQFDRLLAAGRLTSDLLARLAGGLARFHRSAARATPSDPYGTAESIYRPMQENFTQIHPPDARSAEILAELRRWSEQAYRQLESRFGSRKADGAVRECHGDLHLANIVLHDGEPVAFDCLEFDPMLRWIDVMNEVAFLAMDLDAHGRADLASGFVNEYLHHTGDYPGLALLRFYQVYRAIVRAKVDLIRAEQTGIREDGKDRLIAHLDLARGYARGVPRALLITHGFSGSGKTTRSTELLGPCGLIRIRSDVERKRLAGLAPDARTRSAVAAGLYSPASGERTYRHLAGLAAEVLSAGFPVLIDAAFLKRRQRDEFRRLAARLHVPFVILDFQAPEAELVRRLGARQTIGRDASEADVTVLRHQQATNEPLTDDEAKDAIAIDAAAVPDAGQLVDLIRQKWGVR